MRYSLGLLTASLVLAGGASAAEYYVAAEGAAQGDGSRAKPWTLGVALAQPSALQAGDTVWLRGGTYRGPFTSALKGEPGKPIVVRQYPRERATIDCTVSNEVALAINGAWAWYWGFEVCNTSTDRVSVRGAGVCVFGENTKCINLAVHDVGVGFGFWTPAKDAEIYGCLAYNNGWQGAPNDRGHGHGIYAQNAQGTKRIRDNLLFNQFSYGLHIYTEGGDISGFDIEGNIAFNNGVLTRERRHYDNYLVGGLRPAQRIRFIENMGYHVPDRGGNNLQLGYSLIRVGGVARSNGDVTVERNYLAGGAVLCQYWTNVTMVNNTFALAGGSVALEPGPGMNPYSWNRNHYYLTASAPFGFKGHSLDFKAWKSQTGCDADSRVDITRPRGLQVFVRPNAYETNRAAIIVFNWEHAERVMVDPQGVLAKGTAFEIRNAQDFYGPPVLKGNYQGQPLPLPMTRLTLAPPVGVEGRPDPSWPEFNVFILVADHSSQAAPF